MQGQNNEKHITVSYKLSQLKECRRAVFNKIIPITIRHTHSWRLDDAPQARKRQARRFKANKNIQKSSLVIEVRGRNLL